MKKQIQAERVLTAPSGVEILTRQQVADRLGIPPQAIYQLVRSRQAEPMPVQHVGKQQRFVWGEVFAWFINRKRKVRVYPRRSKKVSAKNSAKVDA
jgi:hypothetical protein